MSYIDLLYGLLSICLGIIVYFLIKDKDPSGIILSSSLVIIGLGFIYGGIEPPLAVFGFTMAVPIGIFSIMLLREHWKPLLSSILISTIFVATLAMMGIEDPELILIVFLLVFYVFFLDTKIAGIVFLSTLVGLGLYALENVLGGIFLVSAVNFVAIYLLKKMISSANDDPDYVEDEVSRKLTHLGALVLVPAIVWGDLLAQAFNMMVMIGFKGVSISNFLNEIMLSLGIPILAFFFIIEYYRIDKGISVLPTKLLRPGERHHPAAYIYTIAGLILVALFFSQKILIISALVGLLADAVAAVVGKLYGRIKITKIRTLEGTLAGFLTAFILVMVMTGDLLAGVLVALFLELFDVSNVWGVNDNLIYIVITAVILSFVGV